MKSLIALISFVSIVFFAGAQQNTAAAGTQNATPAMKADSKTSDIKAPVGEVKACCAGKTKAQCAKGGETKMSCTSKMGEASTEGKACCAGKSKAQCSHDTKSCNHSGTEAKACCQKGATMKCSHGDAEK